MRTRCPGPVCLIKNSGMHTHHKDVRLAGVKQTRATNGAEVRSNGPVRTLKDEVTKNSKNWTSRKVEQYRDWVLHHAPSYLDTNFKSDCANLAIRLLIEFAESKKLPVSFQKDRAFDRGVSNWLGATKFGMEFGDALSVTDTDGDYKKLLSAAQRKIGATHLYHLKDSNTVAIDLNQLLPGDLLVGPPYNFPNAMHVQVVLSKPNVQIMVFDIDKVVEIKKKNPGGEVEMSSGLEKVEALLIIQGSTDVDHNGEITGTSLTKRAWGTTTIGYYMPIDPAVRSSVVKHLPNSVGELWTPAGKPGEKSPFGSSPTMLPRRWKFYNFQR